MNGERPVSTNSELVKKNEKWLRPPYFFMGIIAAVLAFSISLFLAARVEKENAPRNTRGEIEGREEVSLLLEFAVFEIAREECRKFRLAGSGEDPEKAGSLPVIMGRTEWDVQTQASLTMEEPESKSLPFDDYVDPSGFFTMPYPAGWLVERAGDFRKERLLFFHPSVENYSIEVDASSVLHNPRDPDYYPSFPSAALSKAERLDLSNGLDGFILESEKGGAPLATLILVACGRKLRFDLFSPPSHTDEAMGVFRELIQRLEVRKLTSFRRSPPLRDLDYVHPCGTFSLTLIEGWRIETDYPSGALFKNEREGSIEITTLDPELFDKERFGESSDSSRDGETIDRGRLLVNGMGGFFVTSRWSKEEEARISFRFYFEKGDIILVGELDAPEPVYRDTLITSFSSLLGSLK
jgi:hypothetical protein